MSPAWYNLPGRWDSDDMERLNATACYSPIVPFPEAYSRLEFGTDRIIAEAAYRSFVTYWHGSDMGV